MIITGSQCRAARALVELSLEQTANLAGLDAAVIANFEARVTDPPEQIKRRLLETLESCGAVFIRENGGGVGVRLKYSRRDSRAINKWEGEGGTAGEDDV